MYRSVPRGRRMTRELAVGRGLTDMQAEFVKRFVETGDEILAVVGAGYTTDPANMAWTLLRTPARRHCHPT
jgi:hypothetical protein